MVTTAGFNALLKLVEEPPPHVKFHLRHDRARQGHRHHPVADAPLPLPARAAADPHRLPGQALRGRGHHRRARGAAMVVGRVRVRCATRCPCSTAAGRCGRGRRLLPPGDGAARLHPRLAARRVRRLVRRGADAGGVLRLGRQGHRGRPGPRRFAEDLLRRLRDTWSSSRPCRTPCPPASSTSRPTRPTGSRARPPRSAGRADPGR